MKGNLRALCSEIFVIWHNICSNDSDNVIGYEISNVSI